MKFCAVHAGVYEGKSLSAVCGASERCVMRMFCVKVRGKETEMVLAWEREE